MAVEKGRQGHTFPPTIFQVVIVISFDMLTLEMFKTFRRFFYNQNFPTVFEDKCLKYIFAFHLVVKSTKICYKSIGFHPIKCSL